MEFGLTSSSSRLKSRPSIKKFEVENEVESLNPDKIYKQKESLKTHRQVSTYQINPVQDLVTETPAPKPRSFSNKVSNKELKVKIANLDSANQYRDKTSIRLCEDASVYKKYPVCQTSTKTFLKYGVGLYLYLAFIKQLSLLFFILSLVSAWPMMSNYQGKGYQSVYQNQRFVYFTLANQEGTNEYEQSLATAQANISVTDKNLNELWPVDFVGGIIFLAFIIFYISYSKKIGLQSTEKFYNISDFAVMVKGFPPFINNDQVIEYFSSYGSVQEVYLARKYEGKLMNYKKIYELSYESILDKKTSNGSFSSFVIPSGFKDKDLILDRDHDELQVSCVFVVFDAIESKNRCLKSSKKFRINCLQKKKTIRRDRTFRLDIKQAPDPSDIIWENIEYSYLIVLRSRILILILNSLIILLSFTVIYIIRLYYYTAPSSTTCKDVTVSGDLALSEAEKVYTSTPDINCYCKQQSINDLLTSSGLQSLCSNYLESLSSNIFINLVVSVSIVSINLLLKSTIRYLSKYEKFSTKTEKSIAIFHRVFLSMFINTAVSTFIVNTNFSSKDSNIPQGRYQDLDRNWYNDVGVSLTVTMIISMFSPHAFNLLIWNPIGMLKRKCCYKRFKSQHKLNNLFKGPNFYISNSLSQIMTTVFANYMYSSGMPFLNVICFITLILSYWCNKYLLLRYYRRPPQYTDNINSILVRYLPCAVLLHSVIGLYAYGSAEIFPTGYTFSTVYNYVVPDQVSFTERCLKYSGISNLVLIFLSFLVFIISLQFNSIYSYFCKKSKIFAEQVPDLKFSSLNSSGLINGLNTYDICSNPKYKKYIIALNTIAKKQKVLRNSNLDSEPNEKDGINSEIPEN